MGSIKTIEKNSGVLESIVTGPDRDTPKRRYLASDYSGPMIEDTELERFRARW